MESKTVAIILVVAAMCPLTLSSRVSAHKQSPLSPERDETILGGTSDPQIIMDYFSAHKQSQVEVDCPDGFTCAPAPCDIDGSNKVAGKECACSPGTTGGITWSGSIPSGSCTALPCGIDGTEGDGPDCHCKPVVALTDRHATRPRIVASGLTGEITWDVDGPHGECVVEAYELFEPSGILEIESDGEQEEEGQLVKPFKCCVSSAGKETKIQYMKADPLPSEGAVRVMGNREGCGYMFGNTYHDAAHKKTCTVPVSKLMAVTGLSLENASNYAEMNFSYH